MRKMERAKETPMHWMAARHALATIQAQGEKLAGLAREHPELYEVVGDWPALIGNGARSYKERLRVMEP